MFVVNGNLWKIEICENFFEKLRRSDGTFSVGCTDNDTKTIYIAMSVKGAFFEKVLCHELCHVFCIEYNYFLPIETEEIVADFVANYGRNVIELLDKLLGNIEKVC